MSSHFDLLFAMTGMLLIGRCAAAQCDGKPLRAVFERLAVQRAVPVGPC